MHATQDKQDSTAKHVLNGGASIVQAQGTEYAKVSLFVKLCLTFYLLGCNFDDRYPEATRCNIENVNGNFVQTSVKGCTYGFVDQTTGGCVGSCGPGFYGVAVF